MERKLPFELFGVECGEGWKGLYQPLLDLCKLYGIEAVQVKEKFGGLRFYIGGCPEGKDISRLIDAAEAASYHICEYCGEHGVKGWDPETRQNIYVVTTSARPGKYWVRTLCEKCRYPEGQSNGKESPT